MTGMGKADHCSYTPGGDGVVVRVEAEGRFVTCSYFMAMLEGLVMPSAASVAQRLMIALA